MAAPLTSLDHVGKSDLTDAGGRTFAEFRRGLKPRWSRVMFDVALGYVALAATVGVLTVAIARAPAWWPAFVVVGGASFGYWHAYINLFMHEAAHFNLAPNKKLNDRLTNAVVSIWIGAHIANYRTIHWEHHRLHGEPGDTERSYFSALDGRFLAETLLMIRAVRVVLFRRGKVEKKEAEVARTAAAKKTGTWMLVCGMLAHGAVLATLVLSGRWPVAIAWMLGMGVFFPFFGALRQLLEHRSVEASRTVDYTKVPHGKTTRMFREGPFASTFGAAGFTRHLLHHWEPSISYTNLPDVERFLSECEPTRELASGKTTYAKAFITLYGR